MPNWCTNSIQISGEVESVNKTLSFFSKVSELQEKNVSWETYLKVLESELSLERDPDHISDLYYLFDISIEDDTVFFQTKWAPPITMVLNIVDKFKPDIKYYYEESGMEIYGYIEKEGNSGFHIEIEPEDLLEIEHIEEEDEDEFYRYKDEEYTSYSEIIDVILDERKERQDYTDTFNF